MRKIKKGDEVIIVTGRDKGRRGTVLRVLPEEDRLLVENVNVVKRHTKGDPNKGMAGGILEKEMPIHLSNVMMFNPASNKGDRVGIRTLEDGRKVRYFKSNNEVLDV